MDISKIGTLILMSVVMSGCASKLRVWSGAGEIQGVPFNAPVVYKKEFWRDRHSKFGAQCTRIKVVQIVTLPVGERFYANVDPAQLAKTGFAMNFSDTGTLSQITLNTEPVAADAIKAATEAITSIAPLVGVGARSSLEIPQTSAANLPACDVGESEVEFIRFED